MASMVDRMLDQAEDLVERYPDSRAARRRAVSNAYYAVFHKLMQTCADALLPGADTESDHYERVYRALEHKPMKNVFKNSAALRSHHAFQGIGEFVVDLQSARMLADYSPPRRHRLTLAAVNQNITRARRAVERLDDLDDDDRRFLAVQLLFRDRSTD